MFADEKLEFRGYTLLIALPAIVLAILGGVSLRNDSVEAALELKERGAVVIAELRAFRDTLRLENGQSRHRFEVFIDDEFRLLDPPAMKFPDQQTFRLGQSGGESQGDLSDLIERSVDEPSMEAALDAIDSAALTHTHKAVFLLRLARNVATFSPLRALELHEQLMNEFFLERSETGTRIGVLGGLYLAEYATHLSDSVETLMLFGEQLLAYPEPFTHVYLETVDEELAEQGRQRKAGKDRAIVTTGRPVIEEEDALDKKWSDHWQSIRQRWRDDQARRNVFQLASVELQLNGDQPRRAGRAVYNGRESILWRPETGGKILCRPYDTFQGEVNNAFEILDVNQFFRTEIRFDTQDVFGEAEGQEVARGRIEGDGRWPGAEVVVRLVDAKSYFASVRNRRWLFGFLITVALLSVAGGLLAMERAFRRQRMISELRSNFVASVSHELRTPVASISLLSEELLDGAKAPEHYNRLIHSESQRLSGLVENVLDASRIERGLKEYEFEACDISALVATTVDAFRPAASRLGIRLELSQPQEGVEAEVDPIALQRALRNLLDNAVKFSEQGKAVSVSLRHRDDHNILISISDEGKGIDPDAQRRIFEPFQRLGSEMRRETTGVGLGLTLVKHVVDGHGGVITVESQPGVGTEFSVSLPKRRSNE